MQVTVYREDGIVTDPTEPLPTLLQRDTQAVWVALDRTRPADLQLLTDVFHFHPLAVEDSQKTGQRPKIEAYEEHLFITIHAARGDHGTQLTLDEVDIFFTSRAVVTVSKTGLSALDEPRSRLARAPGRRRRSPVFILYTSLEALLHPHFPVVERIRPHIGPPG